MLIIFAVVLQEKKNLPVRVTVIVGVWTKSQRTTYQRVKMSKNGTNGKNDKISDTFRNVPKLKAQHKRDIVNMLAMFESAPDIVQYLKDEYGVEVSERAVRYYNHKRQAEIRELRLQFSLELQTIPVANKFARIQIRQNLVNNLLRHLWLDDPKIYEGKIVTDDDGNPVIVKKGNHDVINKILDSISKELGEFDEGIKNYNVLALMNFMTPEQKQNFIETEEMPDMQTLIAQGAGYSEREKNDS